MVRVLHLIPTMEGGGTERQLFLIAKEQLKKGWDVHIALRRKGIYSKELEDIEVSFHKLGEFGRLSVIPNFFSIFFLFIRLKPNILFTWLTHMDVLGGLISIFFNTFWIMTERSSKKAYENSEDSEVATYPFYSLLRKFLSKKANFIVANSQQGCQYWNEIFPESSKILNIPNAIDFDSLRVKSPLKEEYFKGDQPLFLCVGSIIKSKDHKTFIEAINICLKDYDIRALIIGEGSYEKEVRSLIKQYHLEKKISLLPYIQDWWSILHNAKALIHPSLYEGMPNVVLESMAAHCPVILSDTKSHKECFNEESVLFFKTSDPISLSKEMRLVLENKVDLNSQIKNAYNSISSYTITRITSQYNNLYLTSSNNPKI